MSIIIRNFHQFCLLPLLCVVFVVKYNCCLQKNQSFSSQVWRADLVDGRTEFAEKPSIYLMKASSHIKTGSDRIMGSKLKKLLDDPKVRIFLRSPELAMLILVFVSIAIIIISTKKAPEVHDDKLVPTVAEVEMTTTEETSSTTSKLTTTTTTEDVTTTEETTEETTTASETTTVTETTATVSETSEADTTTEKANEEHHSNDKNDTEKAVVPSNPDIAKYINAGISPNADFYQQRIAVAGDSIAYGFNAYGFVPYERNLAQESVSMWNLEYFTFCGGFGLVDAAAYVDPEILYMSLGMNDVNMNDSASFASKYREVIEQILDKCADTTIIVAGITPIGYESSFTSNERIREYNSALSNMVSELNDSRVCYFDAYSVVSDEYGMLRYDCSGGDGIHLQTHCYSDFLNTLYNFLDDTNIREHIKKIEH